jgi:hypothetical protein
VLNPGELEARSRDLAGVDLADAEADEPLRVLVDSFNTESGLHELGREGIRDKLLRILANRLRMKRDFAAHPEIEEQVVKAPIIVVGPPRSGSTKTQKVFSASGDFNYLPMWQTSYPALLTGSRDEPVQARIDAGIELERWMDVASPDMKYCHPFLAMEPEEDAWVLEHSLVSPVFIGFSPVGSYVRWAIKQDIDIQFEYLRDTMKYLQWQGIADPVKRWILKCPMYCGIEPALVRTFPGADLLMTHRTPVSTLPSGASMLELFHKCFSAEAPDIAGYYRGVGANLRRHISNRENDPEMKVLDIHFLDLVGDVESVIHSVYGFAGETLKEESLSNMLDWDRGNPKDARGKHVYSLEQYGFSKEQIEQDFEFYFDFMESRTGRR